MNKKRILLLAGLVSIVFALVCLTGCEKEGEDLPDDKMVGGWAVCEEPQAVELPGEVGEVFDGFVQDYGDDMTPMAYMGLKVEQGMKYAVLCKSKVEEELQVLILSEGEKGKVEADAQTTFTIADYAEGEGAEVTEPLDGGWQVPEDYTKGELPEDVQAAFDSAMEGFTGNELVPMAYLGSQVVAGQNDAILCHSTLVTAQPLDSLQVVIIYRDTDGKASVKNICTIDLASFEE